MLINLLVGVQRAVTALMVHGWSMTSSTSQATFQERPHFACPTSPGKWRDSPLFYIIHPYSGQNSSSFFYS